METIYCSIDAKRLTVHVPAEGRRASGGQETVCYAFVPARARRSASRGGKVVDLASYRADRAPAKQEEPYRTEQQEQARQEPRRSRGGRKWKLLDLCASCAVAAVSLAAVVRFITL